MPWGGTYSAELRRRVEPGVRLRLAELSPHNLGFIEERLRQEGLPLDRVALDLLADGRLPYADGSIDAVVLPQVLEHMPEPERMLEEVRRVPRPGGHAVVGVRNLEDRKGPRLNS